LRLPEVEDGHSVGVESVIALGNGFHGVTAGSVSADHPHAATLALAVAEVGVVAEIALIRLASRLELLPRRPSLKVCRSNMSHLSLLGNVANLAKFIWLLVVPAHTRRQR
jgi:hypothetical protein